MAAIFHSQTRHKILFPLVNGASAAAAPLVALLIMGTTTVNGAAILNPSFEDAGPPTPSGPDFSGISNANWSTSISVSGIWGIQRNTSALAKLILPPDGNAVGVIYRRGNASSIASGDFAFLFQSVDLTDVLSISFDAALNQVNNSARRGTWSSSLEAQFVIDGISYWSQSQAGLYFSQQIDTSSLTGLHDIGFRIVATSNDSDLTGSDWFLFDNLVTTTIPEPSSTMALILGGGLFFLNRRR